MKKSFLTCVALLCVVTLLMGSIIFAYAENVSPAANNVSQINGNGNTVIFIDIPSDYWAKEQIDYFAEQGIVSGYEDGSFHPESGVTREEFCKLLVSTFGQALDIPDDPTFTDVPESRWSYPYVEVCSEFLTGYANPFGGKPSFHPSEYANREDIAVALVRMMGFTDSDASNKNYAAQKFNDGSKISPSLMPYVSIACEKGLISGYPNGNFEPMRGITRAETVVLLNRATKQAVTNINADLEITADVLYSDSGKVATIKITAEQGTTVTVNGETVKMSSNYSEQYEGNYVYKFEQEGSKKFTVEAKKAGKTKKINLTAKYEIQAPTLTVDQKSQTVTKKDFKLSGTARDANYRTTVTVNGEVVDLEWTKWEKSYTLKEGENVFKVVATNENGKSTEQSITITYTVGAPTLTVDQKSQTVTKKDFKLSGTARDANYRTTVTVNGEVVDLEWTKWEKSYTLKEGENVFKVVATNENGKSTEKTITVTFEPSAPQITIKGVPEVTQESELYVSGTVEDASGDVELYINDKQVSLERGNRFDVSLNLTKGYNTFIFRAVNVYGKSKTVSKTVRYASEVKAPKLEVDDISPEVGDSMITISGNVSDSDDEDVKVYVNDKKIKTGSGRFSTKVELDPGSNSIIIVAENSFGKTTTVVKKVKYVIRSKSDETEADEPKKNEKNEDEFNNEHEDDIEYDY